MLIMFFNTPRPPNIMFDILFVKGSLISFILEMKVLIDFKLHKNSLKYFIL